MKTLKHRLRILAGLGFTGLFLWLALRHVDGQELLRAIAKVDVPWLLAGLGAFGVGYACRITRWHLMLQHDAPQLRWRDCAGPLLGSFAVNNVVPFRAGDVLRAFAFRRELCSPPGVIIATLLVERLLDLLMLLVLLGLMLHCFKLELGQVGQLGSTALWMTGAAMVLVLLFPRIAAKPALAASQFLAKRWPGRPGHLHAGLQRGLDTLQHIARGRVMPGLLCWSIAAWACEGLLFWSTAHAIGTLPAPQGSWLALPVATLSTLIPSTPGYVGTFDFFAAHAMQQVGNPVTASMAYALLVHALLWLPPTVIGGLYLLLRSRNPDDRSHA